MKKINVICNIFLSIFFLLACGNNILEKNEESFHTNIIKIEDTQVNIQDLTDFEWDTLYTFEPYTSKEEIEEIIGFKSDDIIDNMTDEGTTYLLFIKDNVVVGNIYGSTDSLGYTINFGSYEKYLCIDISQKCIFSVENENEIKLLEYIKE